LQEACHYKSRELKNAGKTRAIEFGKISCNNPRSDRECGQRQYLENGGCLMSGLIVLPVACFSPRLIDHSRESTTRSKPTRMQVGDQTTRKSTNPEAYGTKDAVQVASEIDLPCGLS
jgi:hypothetical protein